MGKGTAESGFLRRGNEALPRESVCAFGFCSMRDKSSSISYPDLSIDCHANFYGNKNRGVARPKFVGIRKMPVEV